jgi:hypothetical protein
MVLIGRIAVHDEVKATLADHSAGNYRVQGQWLDVAAVTSCGPAPLDTWPLATSRARRRGVHVAARDGGDIARPTSRRWLLARCATRRRWAARPWAARPRGDIEAAHVEPLGTSRASRHVAARDGGDVAPADAARGRSSSTAAASSR